MSPSLRLSTSLLGLLTLLAGASISGCRTAPVNMENLWTPNRATKEHVTSFFLVFPPRDESLWQMPNQTLPQGTPVAFIQTRRGYHQVQLQSLEVGWVPKGSLKRY